MLRNDGMAIVAGLVACTIIGFMIGFNIGAELMKDEIRKNAIKDGAGEYVIQNPQTGDVTFKWEKE